MFTTMKHFYIWGQQHISSPNDDALILEITIYNGLICNWNILKNNHHKFAKTALHRNEYIFKIYFVPYKHFKSSNKQFTVIMEIFLLSRICKLEK